MTNDTPEVPSVNTSPTIPVTHEWLTIGEVAKALRLSKMSVYRLVEGRAFPSYRFGRSVRIRRADFNAYIAMVRQ